MNLTINHPLVQIPAAAASFLAGAFVNKTCFFKLVYIAEYILIKKCGNYDQPKKLDDKILVKIDNKYIKNLWLTTLVGLLSTVSYVTYSLFISSGCPSMIAASAAIGFLAPAVLGISLTIYNHYKGINRPYYAALNEEEINQHQIKPNQAQEIEDDVLCVHYKFGEVNRINLKNGTTTSLKYY